MSFQGDAAREDAANFICNLVKEKLEEYKDSPETVRVLKELGRKVLDELLDAVPGWAREYYRLFAVTSSDIAQALTAAGIPSKTIVIHFDPEIEKEVVEFLKQTEEAYKKAGKSKLHFDEVV